MVSLYTRRDNEVAGDDAHQDFVGCVTKGVEIYEFLDFSGETKKSGRHDAGQEASQGDHIVARFNRWSRRHPEGQVSEPSQLASPGE